MATLQQLEQAFINAHNAGDAEGARVLAQAVAVARQSPANLIPGAEVPETMPQPDQPTIGQRLIGAGETGLTLATGATGGTVGTIAGTLQGLAQAILSGQYGTPEAVKLVEEAATQMGGRFTYQPRTQAGQEMVQSVGEVLQQVPPVLPVLPQLAATPVRPAATQARAATVEAVRPVVEAVGTAVEALRPARTDVTPGSAGAAATAQALQRRTTAEAMPVPFEGKSALTKGQATRDFAQLQFEKEAAKMGEMGAPLRERVENQTATFIQNFDAMIDRLEPIAPDKRELGRLVDRALVNKAEVQRRRISEAYRKAREGGEMQEPISMDALAQTMTELNRFEGVSPNIPAIRREAVRIGALTEDANGNLIPQQMTIENAELLRQFVNQSTDWMDKRQSTFARQVNQSIDAMTEGKGGESYRKARKMRQEFSNEFENVGLTKKLLGTKGKTDERNIALEDVFDKIIISSPVEEMNKLRRTLLTAGDEGKQAWNDLKAETISYIKESSLSPSQKDAAGNPLLSPAQLNKVVKTLDSEGKLESLYGKKQAQILRDLADLSIDIYTAPPGAVNFSNTSSALQVGLDSLGTWLVTGIPGPAATILQESVKFVKNRETRKRINEALEIGKK
jgi:hypothetical protein